MINIETNALGQQKELVLWNDYLAIDCKSLFYLKNIEYCLKQMH